MDDLQDLNRRLLARQTIARAPVLDKPLTPAKVKRLSKAMNAVRTKLGEPETDYEILGEDMYQVPELLFYELKALADSLNTGRLKSYSFDPFDAVKDDKAMMKAALKLEKLSVDANIDGEPLADDKTGSEPQTIEKKKPQATEKKKPEPETEKVAEGSLDDLL